MPPSLDRRSLLKAGAAVAAAGVLVPGLPEVAAASADGVGREMRALEKRYQARLGVFARNVRTAETVAYRSHERFAMCSTFKTLVAAHVLRDYDHCGRFLDRVIHYDRGDLVDNSPVTSTHVSTGMAVRDLCAAALCYSDNTAANLLLRETGGPRGVTRFCRSIGDDVTRLDRWETELNTSIPGDPRDTTTPYAIGRSYGRLALGRVLTATDRRQLTAWLKANTTSAKRFRAGLPDDWMIGDKTGTGGYGSANDIGVAWTSKGTPLVLTVLTVKDTEDAVADDALVADTVRLLARSLAPGE